VIVYPAAVQGEAAAGELVAALQSAARRGECDVLIIGRGGGSLEDLWPFNEERVVRAIAASPIPVISAVGHEVDFTIADFVADLRAPTPAGAAELVVPDQLDWQRSLAGLQSRIATLGQRHLEARAQQLDWLGRRLAQASPTATLSRQSAQLRNLQQIMLAAMRHALTRRGVRVERLRAGLLQQSPALRVNGKILQLAALRHRLHTAGRQLLESRKSRLAYASRSLHAVSPLATLDRGYAIVTESVSGRVLSSVAGLGAGDRISAKLADGSFDAAIERIRGDET
jgi:exodeoxyribonuclease VII large subunit